MINPDAKGVQTSARPGPRAPLRRLRVAAKRYNPIHAISPALRPTRALAQRLYRVGGYRARAARHRRLLGGRAGEHLPLVAGRGVPLPADRIDAALLGGDGLE